MELLRAAARASRVRLAEEAGLVGKVTCRPRARVWRRRGWRRRWLWRIGAGNLCAANQARGRPWAPSQAHGGSTAARRPVSHALPAHAQRSNQRASARQRPLRGTASKEKGDRARAAEARAGERAAIEPARIFEFDCSHSSPRKTQS